MHAIEGVNIDGGPDIIQYQALSYSWGRVKATRILRCSGFSLPITQTLEDALTELQHSTKSLYLWVDAVCINQYDKPEQAEQVTKMLQIYQKAKSVTAWLGIGGADSECVADCNDNSEAIRLSLKNFSNSNHLATCHSHLHDLYNGLLVFYSRPWLTRTWIRQEIYGARHIDVQCGSQRLSWKDYMRLAILLGEMRWATGGGCNRARGNN